MKKLFIHPIKNQKDLGKRITFIFLFFLESAFDDMSSDEMVKMLNNVDLTDPAQASSAIDVVNGLVGGIELKPEFSNIYDTTTTTTTSNELTRYFYFYKSDTVFPLITY